PQNSSPAGISAPQNWHVMTPLPSLASDGTPCAARAAMMVLSASGRRMARPAFAMRHFGGEGGSMISPETMRRVLQEHVDAEHAHDRARVLATYIDGGAEFVDVPTGNVFRDSDEIIGNYQHLRDGFP